MKIAEHEDRLVRDYLENEWPEDEAISRVEKVASERVNGIDYDVFDTYTSKGRFWVITNPTSSYSHDDQPSFDQALSFHIGFTARAMERYHKSRGYEQQERFPRSWRRFNSAVEQFNRAREAEDFQNVAAQCRQCLIAFGRELNGSSFLENSETPPKSSDFKGWAAILARGVARDTRVRSYLKSIADETWNMVAWLVHFEDATDCDADLVLAATANVIRAFDAAIDRYERHRLERCPDCDSYQIALEYRSELEDPPYVVLCATCGWETKVQPYCEAAEAALIADGVEPVKDGFGPPPHINRDGDYITPEAFSDGPEP